MTKLGLDVVYSILLHSKSLALYLNLCLTSKRIYQHLKQYRDKFLASISKKIVDEHYKNINFYILPNLVIDGTIELYPISLKFELGTFKGTTINLSHKDPTAYLYYRGRGNYAVSRRDSQIVQILQVGLDNRVKLVVQWFENPEDNNWNLQNYTVEINIETKDVVIGIDCKFFFKKLGNGNRFRRALWTDFSLPIMEGPLHPALIPYYPNII